MSNEVSDREIIRRREAALKRMLATPHIPHAALKTKAKRKASPSRKTRKTA